MELFNNFGEEDIKVDNLEQIKNSIFSIIDEKKYIYSDLLKRFFYEFDYKKSFSFKFRNKKIFSINKKTLYSLVIYFNDLFFEIDKLYSRDMLFPYKVVKNGVCSNINNLRYIIKLAVLDDSHTKTIKSMLVDDFFEGLSKTKILCYMKYSFFNNQSSYNLKRAFSNDKYDTVITISKGLSDEDIIYIYSIVELNPKLLNKDELTTLILNIEKSVPNIKIVFQNLNKKNYEMINEIYEYIGKVLIFKDKNFVFNNLHLNLDMLDVKDTSFIVFNIKYNDYFFTVKLKSVYNKLIWYIYFNNKIIAKDYCFRPSDCDRLLFLIKDNICEYELNK